MRETGILHNAKGYDFLLTLVTLGRERVFRENVLQIARLAQGESVLDIGCGTGTLAVAAKRHVGETGDVYGIDASPEMIERARAKAAKRCVSISFDNAIAQALPFSDARFDVVLSTIMLHHLPRNARLEALREIRRVLKPQGRFIVVDFEDSGPRNPIAAHFRIHRHGHVKVDDMLALLAQAGFQVRERGPFAKRNIYFVYATS